MVAIDRTGDNGSLIEPRAWEIPGIQNIPDVPVLEITIAVSGFLYVAAGLVRVMRDKEKYGLVRSTRPLAWPGVFCRVLVTLIFWPIPFARSTCRIFAEEFSRCFRERRAKKERKARGEATSSGEQEETTDEATPGEAVHVNENQETSTEQHTGQEATADVTQPSPQENTDTGGGQPITTERQAAVSGSASPSASGFGPSSRRAQPEDQNPEPSQEAHTDNGQSSTGEVPVASTPQPQSPKSIRWDDQVVGDSNAQQDGIELNKVSQKGIARKIMTDF